VSFILTGANVSDFDQARPLLGRHLQPTAFAISAKGYDSGSIRVYVNQNKSGFDKHKSPGLGPRLRLRGV